MKAQNPSKAFVVTLWAAQVLLAIVFFITGASKLFLPVEVLNALIPWTKGVNSLPIRLIGFSEIVGSIGLILPSLLRIKPHLTPWAAIGVAFTMLLAIIFNISISETSVIGINIILFIIAVFIAWGRFRKSPISQKYYKTVKNYYDDHRSGYENVLSPSYQKLKTIPPKDEQD